MPGMRTPFAESGDWAGQCQNVPPSAKHECLSFVARIGPGRHSDRGFRVPCRPREAVVSPVGRSEAIASARDCSRCAREPARSVWTARTRCRPMKLSILQRHSRKGKQSSASHPFKCTQVKSWVERSSDRDVLDVDVDYVGSESSALGRSAAVAYCVPFIRCIVRAYLASAYVAEPSPGALAEGF
jgi:hypothetical protein